MRETLHCSAFRVVDFVAGSGPNCSLIQSASEGTAITCTIIYADYPVLPINPVMTCTGDGQVYMGLANKALVMSQYYLYTSTTVIPISNSSSTTYDCRATFTAPDVKGNPNYKKQGLVTNEPNFTANVTGKRRRFTKIG